MEALFIKEILSSTNGTLLSGNINEKINYISTNSNNIQPNTLFIPIIGENVDGHNFILSAFANGAVATLTLHNKVEDKSKVYIKVNNTLESLQNIAKNYRKKFQIPIIGVTGSVGKTSTKEMIASALSSKYNVLKTFGNMNSQIGLPLTILKIENNHDIAVIELGISKFNEMSKISNIANVDMAVITNIGISHIENLKTKENIRDEKLKIINDLNNKDKTLYLNADDKLLLNLEEIKSIKSRIILFGLNSDSCNYKAKNIEINNQTTSFDLSLNQHTYKILVPSIGIHNVYNSLAAISIGIDLGMTIDEIQAGILSYKTESMRQQIHSLEKITVIDDSYNASPDSIKSGINVLNAVRNKNGKTIAVLADMLELGDFSQTEHFELGKFIANANIDAIIAIGQYAKYIINGALLINPNIYTNICTSNINAFNKLNSIIESNDTILVKGSRGMHTDEIVNMLLRKYGNM